MGIVDSFSIGAARGAARFAVDVRGGSDRTGGALCQALRCGNLGGVPVRGCLFAQLVFLLAVWLDEFFEGTADPAQWVLPKDHGEQAEHPREAGMRELQGKRAYGRTSSTRWAMCRTLSTALSSPCVCA
jgi:hypothetical protein